MSSEKRSSSSCSTEETKSISGKRVNRCIRLRRSSLLFNERKPTPFACFSESGEVIQHFLGTATLKNLTKKLPIENVCLFYLLKTEDSLCPEVRLHLGYKDEVNQIFIYPLYKRYGEWIIEEDETGASFESLEILVNHYKNFRFINDGTSRLSLLPTKRAENDTETVFEDIQK